MTFKAIKTTVETYKEMFYGLHDGKSKASLGRSFIENLDSLWKTIGMLYVSGVIDEVKCDRWQNYVNDAMCELRDSL